MRNQTDVLSKNSTASFKLREGESAMLVVDSQMDGSSIERHRKRIFEGRSKSVRARRNNLSSTVARDNSSTVKPEQNGGAVMKKMEEMQQQINRLTELLQQKERRETEEQRKVNDIISIKNREVRSYIDRIEQLTNELDSKNRELQSSRLEIQRLQRFNRLQHETEQLSELVEQENGRIANSFFDQSSSKYGWHSRPLSLAGSPQNSAEKKLSQEIYDVKRPVTENFLSPFSVTRMVEGPENGHCRNPSPLKDTKSNLLSFTVPAGGFQQHQQVVVRPTPSPTPLRGGTIDSHFDSLH